MKYVLRYSQISAILFAVTFLFSACTFLTPRISKKPEADIAASEANRIITTLKNQSQTLKTFKGMGSITFKTEGKKDYTSRIAWIASVPDKIRVTLISVSGQPAVSVASDGHWLYFISHLRGDFYKKPATTSSMKRLFSIPFNSQDVVDILAGRIPMPAYDSAVLMEDRSHDETLGPRTAILQDEKENMGKNGYILVLKKSWGDILEKIYLDHTKKEVHMVEVFDRFGALVYRIKFSNIREVSGFRVPYRLLVSNDDGSGFQLVVDRYWTNTSVSPEMFVLTAPD